MACSLKGYNIAVMRSLLDELSSYPLSTKDIRIISSCNHKLYSIIAFWRKECERAKVEFDLLKHASGPDDLPF